MTIEIPLDDENENWLQSTRRKRTGELPPIGHPKTPPPPQPQPLRDGEPVAVPNER